MSIHLHKSYKYLLSLPLLTFCSGQVLAEPGIPGAREKLKAHMIKTPPVGFWVESFTLPNGALTGTGTTPWTSQYTGPGQASQRFSVLNNEFRINNITVNGTGTWTSGSINIAGKTDVAISVDLRSGVTGNGSLDNDNSDHYDYINLYYKIDGGAEQLFWQKRGAINSNSPINTTVTKDSLSGSTLQVIIRARATATDEFYFFDNVTVEGIDQVTVDAHAAVSGVLTCADTTVLLSGSSSASGVSYSWSGPDGFTSGDQQTNVSVPGIYLLTVAGPGGAVVTDTIVVTQNIMPLAGLSAFATDQLTCFNTSVNINGSSSTPGVVYRWTGPGNFSATTATAAVTAGGVYTLKVTNPVNGCFSTIPLTVREDKIPPADVLASHTGALTCAEPYVIITGGSFTPNVDYNWTGPDGFSSSLPEEYVYAPGDYILTVMNLLNGCVAYDTVTVEQDLSDCEGRKSISSMRVGPDEADKVSAGAAEWKLYPNPARDNFFVVFRCPGSGQLTVSLYNSSGMPEKLLFNSNVTAGQLFSRAFDAGKLPAGLHYCVVSINNKTYFRRLLLLQ